LHEPILYNLAMNNTAIKVTVRNGTVTVKFPLRLLGGGRAAIRRPARNGRRALRAVRGMWRRRKLDPLEYQRAVRGEWN